MSLSGLLSLVGPLGGLLTVYQGRGEFDSRTGGLVTVLDRVRERTENALKVVRLHPVTPKIWTAATAVLRWVSQGGEQVSTGIKMFVGACRGWPLPVKTRPKHSCQH